MKIEQGLSRADCKRSQFSGIRYCNILDQYEIWLLGQVKKEVSSSAISADHRALPAAYEEVFGLNPGSVTSGRP